MTNLWLLCKTPSLAQDYLDVTLPLLSPSSSATCTTASSNCSGSTLVCGGEANDMDTTGSTLTAPGTQFNHIHTHILRKGNKSMTTGAGNILSHGLREIM